MAVDPPPIQEPSVSPPLNVFPQVWVRWFESIRTEIQELSASASVWGSITGTLSDQSDLQSALNAKQDSIETYEFINKNLYAYDSAITYTGGVPTSIVYSLPSGSITKTLNYTGGLLTSIVLSGDTPSGIDLTKTLTYTGSDLTGVAYS